VPAARAARGAPARRGRRRGGRPELWWHVYVGACAHAGGTVQLTFGGSSLHPEALAADPDLRARPLGLGCDCEVLYLRSYDHEPTPAERAWVESALDDLFRDHDWGDDGDDDPAA
jgi:hypothetical protein